MSTPSTSSTPSNSSDLTYYKVTCKVCLKIGHGLHFGIETCRACAAFFRRTVVLNCKYKCRKLVGKCEFQADDDKSMCKFCRFKKCLDLGMTTENVRTDHVPKDLPSTSSENKIVQLRSKSSGNPKEIDPVAYNITHPKTRGPAVLLDVNAIIKKSRAILETYFLPDEDCLSSLNPLQRMVYSLQKIRSKQSWNPEFIGKINFLEIFYGWELQMRDTATWLMHSNEFRNLPDHERVAIFKIVWAVWRRFERFTMTAEVFGQKCYDDKILLQSTQHAIRLESYSVDYSTVSEHGFERFNSIFGGKMIQYYDIIVKPFLELKLSETEVTYILCQIIWNHAGRRLQGQTQAAGEKFLEEISNNLHGYYEERNLENPAESQNYASRLGKMMQIVNNMLVSSESRNSN
ncbi:hypothetical protein CAEBREN_13569 [Caenorhabditis brenneri]|uniref:Uncharacterized protein n=1 Tax=Caenorhabditis brenneri TaxID=135651 RepID=G0N335_CAEBE|nr:hypothetical protein CAEBREN_13569 [Caenorhabditis brenneri]